MVIASTGHCSAAWVALLWYCGGTVSTITSAMSEPIEKTSGQVSTHKPQAVHVSSTLVFISLPFRKYSNNDFYQQVIMTATVM